MTEPSAARPAPGPAPRQPASGSPAVGAPSDGPPAPATMETGSATAEETAPATAGVPRPGAAAFADLPRRPVEEHVAVYEAEHARLQRELSTVDRY